MKFVVDAHSGGIRTSSEFSAPEVCHLIYSKPGVKRPLVIPAYPAVPVIIIKNLLRAAEMTRERYFELL